MGGNLRTGYRSNRITSAATTAVKAKSGVIVRVIVEAALTGTVTINDTNGTVTILPATLPAGAYTLEIDMAGKIEVVTSAADKIVVVFD